MLEQTEKHPLHRLLCRTGKREDEARGFSIVQGRYAVEFTGKHQTKFMISFTFRVFSLLCRFLLFVWFGLVT